MAALVAQSLGVYAPLNDPRLVEVRLAINGMLIQPTSNLFSHSLRVLRPTRTALVNDTVRDTELHFNPRILKTSQDKYRDGNSRSQRVFFTRYLNAAGWDVDWMAINASAVHAARHVAMATVDSSYLAAELRPGVVPIGSAAPGSLARTQGRRDARTSVHLYDAMRAHKRTGLPTATFRAQTAAAGPLSTGSDQPPAGPGRTQAPPRSLRPGSVSSQPSPRRGQGR